jgi:uncharacterized protein (DUF885 family)
MGELGHLDDPEAYLGMLDTQTMSAANVALDIGVHLEALSLGAMGLDPLREALSRC